MPLSTNTCTVDFPDTDYAPATVRAGESLSVNLTLQNSPVLFGCRTGICGTCLVAAAGAITPPNVEEQEVLDILAPNCANARLACQLRPQGDITITPIQS